MASVPTYTLLFSSLIISLFLFTNPVSAVDPQTQQLIDKVCRQMEDYGFCSKTFTANLKSPSTDLAGLTQITMELTAQHASNDFVYSQSILKKEIEPDVKRVLTECVNDYNSIMESFIQAMRSFALRDYKGMLNYELPNSRLVALCQEAFNSAKPGTVKIIFFLTERNRQLRILIAMSVVTGYYLMSQQCSLDSCCHCHMPMTCNGVNPLLEKKNRFYRSPK